MTEETAQEKPKTRREIRTKKLIRTGVWILSSLAVTLLLFEAAYRYMIVDFYAAELNGLNAAQEPEGKKPALLVMGDSFSATRESYVGVLRDSLPQYRIINSAIPGTGAVQASFLAKKRFNRFQPEVFVYQIYVGNDLFDLRYPANWETISRTRNLYWRFCNDLRSLSYLNYKMGQFSARRPDFVPDSLVKVRSSFSVDTYNAREKLYLKAEPWLVENSVMLKEMRGMDFFIYRGLVKKLLERCPDGRCEAYVLVIPHCAQVSKGYLYQSMQLGAVFSNTSEMGMEKYPFYNYLEEFVTAKNIHFVNPLPALQQGELVEPMYYANDPHLSAAGQQVVARVLLDSLHK